MIRTIRLNAHPTKDRAMEEVRGLMLAFAGHPLAAKPGFMVDASLYQGEFHTTVTADVDTSGDGFLSTIIARVLSSHLRVPAPPARTALPLRQQGQALVRAAARQPITVRALPRPPRFPRPRP